MDTTPDRPSSPSADHVRTERPRAPRWVKVLAMLGAMVAALVVIALLVGGEHGPQRHGAAGAEAGPTVDSGARG
ncbi:hypothetical protein AB6N24_08920 [Cellulomonas sp. 179-A 4D5 NHS]